MFDTATVLSVVDSTTRLLHLTFKARYWCKKMSVDFCVMMHYREVAAGTWLVVGRSISHPKCPPSDDFIRGKILTGGWLLRPCPENSQHTICTYVAHIDLSSASRSIPAWLQNMANSKQPLIIANLGKLF
eukprot:TRINITY_DN3081_c0_g1_i2.p1 TRINITY_DN3081_c0_g1~~TRINITY_DN3081_c0_g1_i2.p1  ORF type:complete len:130 (-),score=21.81 TRINITY_DN3081_c0_g1_i2:49-438(-)